MKKFFKMSLILSLFGFAFQAQAEMCKVWQPVDNEELRGYTYVYAVKGYEVTKVNQSELQRLIANGTIRANDYIIYKAYAPYSFLTDTMSGMLGVTTKIKVKLVHIKSVVDQKASGQVVFEKTVRGYSLGEMWAANAHIDYDYEKSASGRAERSLEENLPMCPGFDGNSVIR